MNWQEFKKTYDVDTNFLIFQGVMSAVYSYMKSLNIKSNQLIKPYGPIIPTTISIFMKSTKGSKDMYNVLNEKITNITSQEKWSLILNRHNIIWNKIYRLPFYITKTQNYSGSNTGLITEFWELINYSTKLKSHKTINALSVPTQ